MSGIKGMSSDITVKLGADASEFKDEVSAIRQGVDVMAEGTTARLARLGEAFSGVKDIVGTTVSAISGAVEAAMDFVEPAAALQRVEAELRGLTGSAVEAKRVMSEIGEWGVGSQYDPRALQESAVTLIKSGLGKDYVPSLVRELAVIAQGDQAKMDALVAAMAKGGGGLKGFNSEILEAFNAAQVDLLGAMEKTTGLSGEGLKTALSEGIGLDEVAGAIRDLAGDTGVLKSAQDEVSGTFEGLQQRVSNAWRRLQEELGAGLLGPMSELMEGLEGELVAWGERAGGVGEGLGAGLRVLFDVVSGLSGAVRGVFGFLVDEGDHVVMVLAGIAAGWRASQSAAVGSLAAQQWSMKGMVSALGSVKVSFAGLWTSVKTGAASAAAAVKTACAGIAASVKVSMYAVRSAIISTGVGALVVALGEGFAYLYRQVAGGEDEGGGVERVDDGERRAAEVARWHAFDRDHEGYESEVKKARSGVEVDAVLARAMSDQRRVEDELAAEVARNGLESEAAEVLREEVETREERLEELRGLCVERVRWLKEQAEAEKRSARLAEEKEKAEKDLAARREKLGELEAKWVESEWTREYKAGSVESKGGMLGAKAAVLGAEGSVEGVTARIDELKRGELTEGVMRQIEQLDGLRKKYLELGDEREESEGKVAAARKEQELRLEELRGKGKRAEQLRYELDVAEGVEKYQGMGLSTVEAKRMAQRDVGIAWLKDKREGVGEGEGVKDIVKQVGVEMGNGGKSLGMSEGLLGVGKQQLNELVEIRRWLDRHEKGAGVAVMTK